MTLRTRLVATTLAVALPLSLGLLWWAERSRHADMDSRLDSVIATEPCSPEGGPRGPRRGNAPIDVFPYDASLQIATPDGRGPDFPESLRLAVLEQGRASGSWSTPDGRGRQIAVRITRPDAGCVYALARLRPRPGEYRDQLIGLASIVVTVFVAVAIAVGPTLARLQRLTMAVRRSAADRYATPVPTQHPSSSRWDSRDEVSLLTEAFNAAGREVRSHVDKVEARETALREFVANTTHDVAVPLTVLQTHLAALEQHELPAEASDAVRGGMREAHYMGSLLRNLSAASRLDAGLPTAPSALDLNAVIERVVARHQPLARSAGVALDLAVPSTPTIVEADSTLLEQAIGNLVDNAVRYNRVGGHVAVVLDVTPPTFLLTVTDDGVGVHGRDLAHLTERRFRGDQARTRRPGGQGLGLAIAAEVLAQLGWTLTFANHYPIGLRATISGSTKT